MLLPRDEGELTTYRHSRSRVNQLTQSSVKSTVVITAMGVMIFVSPSLVFSLSISCYIFLPFQSSSLLCNQRIKSILAIDGAEVVVTKYSGRVYKRYIVLSNI